MPATLLAQAGKVFEARFLQPKRNWIADGRLGSKAEELRVSIMSPLTPQHSVGNDRLIRVVPMAVGFIDYLAVRFWIDRTPVDE
jgi:hypothetical protein